MATHLLVNPRAGSGERGLEFWRCRLAASGVALSGCWEVGEDWQHLVESGDDLLVAGGDGTWHALLGECMRRSLRLGLLPSGTGNDLARSLGVPLDPQGAVEVIAAGGVRLIDLAEADGAFFVNVLHIGAGATVSRTVATVHKRRWGRLAYLREIARKICQRDGIHVQVCTGDGEDLHGRWLEVAVANGPSFGGGESVPGAAIDDGRLDLIAVPQLPVSHLLWHWVRAKLTRNIGSDSGGLVHLSSQSFHVQASGQPSVSMDGEPVEQVPRLIRVHRHALSVFITDSSADLGVQHAH